MRRPVIMLLLWTAIYTVIYTSLQNIYLMLASYHWTLIYLIAITRQRCFAFALAIVTWQTDFRLLLDQKLVTMVSITTVLCCLTLTENMRVLISTAGLERMEWCVDLLTFNSIVLCYIYSSKFSRSVADLTAADDDDMPRSKHSHFNFDNFSPDERSTMTLPYRKNHSSGQLLGHHGPGRSLPPGLSQSQVKCSLLLKSC